MTLVLDTEKCSGSTWVLSRMYTSYQLHHCQRCLWGLKVGLTSNSWQFQLESWWILALDGFPWLSQLRIPFLSLNITDDEFFWDLESVQFTSIHMTPTMIPQRVPFFLPGSARLMNLQAVKRQDPDVIAVNWSGDFLLRWGIEQHEHSYFPCVSLRFSGNHQTSRSTSS